ncbi:hypothetical protein ACFY12_32225 [Streptomyces sp. NPDC001339]|uniref:hypothetical protein n=1 Tax=Streptomyces sp. NPDC001339 TaxID=3364563 RepID=UPI0036CC7820
MKNTAPTGGPSVVHLTPGLSPPQAAAQGAGDESSVATVDGRYALGIDNDHSSRANHWYTDDYDYAAARPEATSESLEQFQRVITSVRATTACPHCDGPTRRRPAPRRAGRRPSTLPLPVPTLPLLTLLTSRRHIDLLPQPLLAVRHLAADAGLVVKLVLQLEVSPPSPGYQEALGGVNGCEQIRLWWAKSGPAW